MIEISIKHITLSAGIALGLYFATGSGWSVLAAICIGMALGDLENQINKKQDK